MPTKTKKSAEHKRHGRHHQHSKQYKQVYWPFMPLLISVLTFGLMAFSFFRIPAAQSVLAYASEMSAQSLLTATNDYRSKSNLASLQLNSKLSEAAQSKAKDMVERNYWSHTTPDGKEPWVFINQAGYKYTKAGENLAYGFSSGSATVAGWMNSTSHKANMLDSSYTEVGFGFANSSDFVSTGNQTVVVAMYGQPLTVAAPTKPKTEATDKPEAAPEKLPETPGLEYAPAASSDNDIREDTEAVTKAEVFTNGRAAWAPFALGILGGSAATGLFVSHGLRLRKLFARAEHYFVAHPLFDISLIGIGLLCIELSRTAGFIR